MFSYRQFLCDFVHEINEIHFKYIYFFNDFLLAKEPKVEKIYSTGKNQNLDN